MLVVNTYIDRSEIDGLGLFAGQDIEEGDIIWFLDPSIDHVFDKENFNKIVDLMPEDEKEKFKKWSFTRGNDIILPADNAKFENHSNNPNQICNGKYDLASRRILKGEEITCDYRQFEDDPNQTEINAYEKENQETRNEIRTA